MYVGKPNLRLALSACEHEVVQEVRPSSPVQTPSSTASSHSTVTSPHSPQSEAFHWPDVQELRSKYTDKPACICTGPHRLCRTRCDGCSQKSSSSSELHSAQTDGCRQQSECPHGGQRLVVEDWPQHQKRPLLCRWSSVDLGSLPLHEVQNLQEPVRAHAPVCRVQSEDGPFQDRPNGTKSLSSGKSSESLCVKSLREKFQSLSTS